MDEEDEKLHELEYEIGEQENDIEEETIQRDMFPNCDKELCALCVYTPCFCALAKLDIKRIILRTSAEQTAPTPPPSPEPVSTPPPPPNAEPKLSPPQSEEEKIKIKFYLLLPNVCKIIVLLSPLILLSHNPQRHYGVTLSPVLQKPSPPTVISPTLPMISPLVSPCSSATPSTVTPPLPQLKCLTIRIL